MNNIRNLISILGHEAIIREGRAEKVLEEHQAIIDAIGQRDATRALAAMRTHLETTEDFLAAQISALAGT